MEANSLTSAAGTETAHVRVSVVIPCLNEADTLAECVEKAQRTINENRIAAEVIVADTGSSVIRKVDKITGLATIVAGGGSRLEDSLGLAATQALIPRPAFIPVDAWSIV